MRVLATYVLMWHGLYVMVTTVTAAEASKLIEMLFGDGQTCVGPTSHILDGGTCGHHLANAIERSMLGSDAGYC